MDYSHLFTPLSALAWVMFFVAVQFSIGGRGTYASSLSIPPFAPQRLVGGFVIATLGTLALRGPHQFLPFILLGIPALMLVYVIYLMARK